MVLMLALALVLAEVRTIGIVSVTHSDTSDGLTLLRSCFMTIWEPTTMRAILAAFHNLFSCSGAGCAG